MAGGVRALLLQAGGPHQAVQEQEEPAPRAPLQQVGGAEWLEDIPGPPQEELKCVSVYLRNFVEFIILLICLLLEFKFFLFI